MKELLQINKKEALSSFLTLVLAGAAYWFPGMLSPSGQVTMPREQAIRIVGVVAAIILGLLSYTIQLWRLQKKRERIRFAKETGRQICQCTETGEIMLLVKRDQMASELVCRVCKRQFFDLSAPDHFPPLNAPLP